MKTLFPQETTLTGVKIAIADTIRTRNRSDASTVRVTTIFDNTFHL